jgi:methylenetetrahydrofolate dehydrogenase (NADP+)/methenyltetrahydrofolate cyclohydrolase
VSDAPGADAAARLLDGKRTARILREEVAAGCVDLARSHGVVPGLGVVLVGDDPASQIYVRNKERAAAAAGMTSRVLRLPATAGDEAILAAVAALNADPAVHGILVQLPLPRGVGERAVLEAVDPAKDVDGFHPINAGRLLSGGEGFVPCTPAGILELLRRHDVPLAGRHAVVVGRSNIVGKPMALLLLREHATVTICHSRTSGLAEICARADVLVAAAGRLALITESFIKPGATVIDVGIHRVEDAETCRRLFGDDPARLAAVRETGATLAGDVHPLAARARAGLYTPVPGGVGPLTIAQLLRNTLHAARRSVGLA